MKKIIIACAFVMPMLFVSCKGTYQTATMVPVHNSVSAFSIADLDVKGRVSYRYTPTESDKKGGFKNCAQTAVAALLQQNGNADVLVSPEYKYDSKLSYIEVSGRPAFYKNFRTPQQSELTIFE